MNDNNNINNDSDDLFKELAQQDITDVKLIRTDNPTNTENTIENIDNPNNENDKSIYSDLNETKDNISNEDYSKDEVEENTTKYDTESKAINGWTIFSLIFGIASLAFCFLSYIGFATAIIGILLAAISKKYSKSSMSTIAIVMCVVGIFITLIYSIFKVIIFII